LKLRVAGILGRSHTYPFTTFFMPRDRMSVGVMDQSDTSGRSAAGG
jgi:hypothetical protein